jgi:hypothetical protein
MKYKAKLSTFTPTGNVYLDINNEIGNEVFSLKVIHRDSIVEESFINDLMESVDKIYEKVNKRSPFSKLFQADDDQRMMAMLDIQALLSIFDNAFSKGSVSEIDGLNMLEIAKRWNGKNGTMLFPEKKTEPMFI